MQFNSIAFIFYFLPVFLAVYYLLPEVLKRSVLVLGSFVFYYLSGGGLWVSGLLAVLTVLSYLGGLTLAKKSRVLLGGYLATLLGILTFFKLWAGGRYLPAGMSFYLFQVAAYLMDVQRGKMDANHSLLSHTAQIVMFPKLLSGPLMQPKSLQSQQGIPTAERIHRGIQEFVLGLAMKVILANRIGGLWRQAGVQGYGNMTTVFAWMTLVGYAMQLYFDFYGYSLMAVGLGRMLGYDLPKNFDEPYSSRTVSEFYRRWHITLGAWFREYLYFPLGGSRNGAVRTVLNLALVWAFTGLWHGTGGNYLLWAGFLLACILLERFCLGKLLNRSRVLSHVYLVFVILLSWVPFAVGDWGDMVAFLGRLFCFSGAASNPLDYLTMGSRYFSLLAMGLVLATPWPRKLWHKLRDHAISDVLLLVLFWVAMFYLSTAAQDPFLYFKY